MCVIPTLTRSLRSLEGASIDHRLALSLSGAQEDTEQVGAGKDSASNDLVEKPGKPHVDLDAIADAAVNDANDRIKDGFIFQDAACHQSYQVILTLSVHQSCYIVGSPPVL